MSGKTDEELLAERSRALRGVALALDDDTRRGPRERLNAINRELLARREETSVVSQTLSHRVFRGGPR